MRYGIDRILPFCTNKKMENLANYLNINMDLLREAGIIQPNNLANNGGTIGALADDIEDYRCFSDQVMDISEFKHLPLSKGLKYRDIGRVYRDGYSSPFAYFIPDTVMTS